MAVNVDEVSHLWASAHTLAHVVPSASRYFVRTLTNCIVKEDGDAKLGELANRGKPICMYCSSIFVPGQNCSVRIRSTGLSKRQGAKAKKNYKTTKKVLTYPTGAAVAMRSLHNVVQYSCHNCLKITQMNGATRAHVRQVGRRSMASFQSKVTEAPSSSSTNNLEKPKPKTSVQASKSPTSPALKPSPTTKKTSSETSQPSPKSRARNQQQATKGLLKSLVSKKPLPVQDTPKLSLADFLQSIK